MRQLREARFAELLILPLLLPMEPSFPTWLSRLLARWRAAEPDGWPDVRLAPAPTGTETVDRLLVEMLGAARASEPLVLSQQTR